MGNNNTKSNVPTAQYSASNSSRANNTGQFGPTYPQTSQYRTPGNNYVQSRTTTDYTAQQNTVSNTRTGTTLSNSRTETISQTRTGTGHTAPVAGKTQSFEPDSKHPYQILQSKLTQEASAHHIANQQELLSSFNRDIARKVITDNPVKHSQYVAPGNSAQSSTQSSEVPKVPNITGNTQTGNFAPSAPSFSELHSDVPVARVTPCSATSSKQKEDYPKTMKENLNHSSVGQSTGNNGQQPAKIGVVRPHSSETGNVLRQNEVMQSITLVNEQTAHLPKSDNNSNQELMQCLLSYMGSINTAGDNVQQQLKEASQTKEDCKKIDAEISEDYRRRDTQNDSGRADRGRGVAYNRRSRGDAHTDHKRGSRSSSGGHRGNNYRGRKGERGHYRKTKQGALGRHNDLSSNFSERLQSQKSSSTESLESTGSHRSRTVRTDTKQAQSGSYLYKGFHSENNVGNCDFKQKYTHHRYFIGYQRLLELVDGDPEEAVIVLANKHSGFYELLKDNLKPDWLMLIVKLLANICKTNVSDKKKEVLTEACSPGFHEQLSTYLASVSTKQNENDKLKVRTFISNLTNFYATLIELTPVTACEPTVLATIDAAIYTTLHYLRTTDIDDILNKLVDLKNKIKLTEENEREDVQKEVKLSEDDNVANFREITVIPTTSELKSNREPFLRAILTQGPYTNVEHYLDVHFRLLKEDLIRPLRENISSPLKGKNKRIRNIRFYRKTYFTKLTMVGGKVGIIVNFDPDNHMEKAKLTSCSMLRCDSLLCFSNNNFKDVLFATVLCNYDFMLKKGFVVVSFLDMEENTNNEIYSHPYVMIELKLKFKPYFHTLMALQKMQADEFPMTQYIISAGDQRVPPEYLWDAQNGRSKPFTIDGKDVFPTDIESWPKASQLQLDESQYSAFQTALTEKFVLIQGPPGTGKKFLSLKIVKTLIENSQAWNSKKAPILVICLRDSTLDQLLEGFLKFTPNIVRIGGKSSNEWVNQLNLKEKQKSIKRTGPTYHLFSDMRNSLSSVAASFKKLQGDIEAVVSNCGILSIASLESCMSDIHFNSFKNNRNEVDNSVFIRWLEEGLSTSFAAANETETTAYMNSLEENVNGKSNNITFETAISDVTEDDLDLEVDLKKSNEYINFALDFKDAQEAVATLKKTIINIKKNSQEKPMFNVVQNYEEEVRKLKIKLKYFQDNLQSDQKLCEKLDPMHNLSDLWATDSATRWFLYKHWVSALKCKLLEELQQLASDVILKLKEFEKVKAMEDYELLMNSDIVGITTTAAIHLQPLLKRLECKIVLVEEANEILESQVAVFLTSHCQHLIMIGESLQLRPSTSVYELRQKYNLDLSLFERMLNNGIHCENLKTQHRMRSEFVRLLVPAIYPAISTHGSVKKYEDIAGVVSNLFFVTHQETEEEVPGLKSYRNPHEGDFLAALCRYLILQGYAPEKITILTTYVAQVFYIQQKLKSTSLLKDVRVICMDSFKGEENDIILLSLVRSNSDGNIDFWKVESRISGALSRARNGFYIIGNMDCFTLVSDTWKKINNALKSMAAIGPSLELRCQFHSEQLNYVVSASDFVRFQEGCQLPCNDQLPCGHNCPSPCHLQNRDHSNVKCMKPCERSPEDCKLGHRCEKRCYEECGVCGICKNRVLKMPCGHTVEVQNHKDAVKQLCTASVLIKLPCGHETVKPCHQKAEKIFCPHPCENRLQCGHQCLRKCHINHDPDHLRYKCRKKCGRMNAGCRNNHVCEKACYEECSPCSFTVKQELPCKHIQEIPCVQDPKEVICQMNCKKMLPCGHQCKMRCGEPCGNCQVEVQKTIKKCGHSVKEKCSLAPNPNKCKSPCKRVLPCGHKCTRKCGQSCITECNASVQSTEPGVCGHKLTIPCHMDIPGIYTPEQLLKFCNEPCNTLLDCGHVCSGTCAKCFQGRVHVGCNQDCNNVLICGHKCPVPCSANCPPCSRQCSHRCRHSKCANKCGEPCTPCREKCGWQCEHLKCTRQCHELCDRKPCYEPCKLKLKCGHSCIGFCGDPCPPLCHICNYEEVTSIFLGHEADRNARFVLLEDCDHVIESKGLETWLKQSEGEITTKVCPRCKTPITKTQRYSNDVKIALKDICEVKAKVFGIQKEIESKRSLLLQHITQLMQHASYVMCPDRLKQHLEKLKQQLLPVQGQRRNQLSMMDTESLELHIKFMQEIIMTLRYGSGGMDTHSFTKIGYQVQFFLDIVETRGRYLSSQEVNDINCELSRFISFLYLCRLESTRMYKMHCNNAHVQYQYDIARKTVCSVKKFTAEQNGIFRQALGNLNSTLNNAIALPTQERQQIVKALNLKHGRWYKCPNGHPYVITECGRAMQVSKCNICGAKIGGRRHTLLPSNRVATEMN